MAVNTWPGWECAQMLGEGSYGKVYRILRQEFGTTYEAALKVMTIPKSQNEVESAYAEGMDEQSVTAYFRSCVEDIVAEFALMSQLKGNSNIVSYEDHMVIPHEDGIGWDILIRMELLTPLNTYCKDHSLTEDEVVRLGSDLCKALKLCRKKGILHRDIKPENIFVNKDGDFKLGDFGVARVTEKTVSAMSQKGTYVYMAPEVYKGEPYGYSADLYSLGLVLYRLLNDNRMPFMPPAPQPIRFNDREKALNQRMMNQPMPAPAHGSEALKAVIVKACAYHPEDRYPDAEALEKALMGSMKTVSSVYDDDDDEDYDDFEKTVSGFGRYRPVRKSLEEPLEVLAEHELEKTVQPEVKPFFEYKTEPEKMPAKSLTDPVEIADEDYEDDEDDFEKTVSRFDAYQPRKKQKEEPALEVEEGEEQDDEDDFERTVSAFAARHRNTIESGGRKKDEISVEKPVSAQTISDKEAQKAHREAEKIKEKWQKEIEDKEKGKRPAPALIWKVLIYIFVLAIGGVVFLPIPIIGFIVWGIAFYLIFFKWK